MTGPATYAADHNIEGVVHAAVVNSTAARGRITGINTSNALAQPGVLRVISHRNAPRLPYLDNPTGLNPQGRRLPVFQDDRVLFFGQPVAVVVADTHEAAQHAASLVEVSYEAEQPDTDLGAHPGTEGPSYSRGDADAAVDAAEVRLEQTYRMARNHHNPMEPHATIARWDGDRLTVWDKTQWPAGTSDELASVFGIPQDSVRCVSPFVGGAFGSAGRAWPHVTIAALAARETGRPVKLVLTREQLYFGIGYRSAFEYALRLGSDRGGRVSAAVHEAKSETSTYETYADNLLSLGQILYDTPNVRQVVRTVPLDVNTPTFMRGPGYASAAFPLESAMDELAHELGIDPIELRLRNEPDVDPSTGLPFSTRRLRDCYTIGAEEFGWRQRDSRPRATRDGNWLIGTGVAAGVYHANSSRAQSHILLDARGTALVQSASSDMGPGTYTSMTQVAADALGLPVDAVEFRLGDSTMPTAGVHGGSQTMASIGSAVQDGCDKMRQQAVTLAVNDTGSPLHGVPPEDVLVRRGRLHVKNDPTRGETYQQLLGRNNRSHLEMSGIYTPSDGRQRFSMHSYGATFAEVAVDERLGLVRIRRMLGVYDAGRIINPKLAESQAIGGMVGGIGAALLEHTITDHRDGRITNPNLAEYLVPVNADVPALRAVFVESEDTEADPLGVKGLGEVVQVGVAPAITNAVFHATGRRIRQLPVTLEAML